MLAASRVTHSSATRLGIEVGVETCWVFELKSSACKHALLERSWNQWGFELLLLSTVSGVKVLA